MRSEIKNGKVVIINETIEESIQTMKDIFEEMKVGEFDEIDAACFDIKGGETNAELSEMASDYRNDLATERSAYYYYET